MADSNTPALQDSEHNEPGDMTSSASSGLESPPMWMWGIIFLALISGVYLIGSANLINIGPDPWPRAAAAEGTVMTVAETPALDGAPIYSTRCITCHQQGGTGMPGLFPPLANSEWVTGNPDNVIRIVLHGIQGPIDVAGESYNSVMPGLAIMPDDEVAAVVSHIRTSFGNSASAVTPADVARIRGEDRATPWTADELSAMPGASAPAASPVVAAATPAPAATTPVAPAVTSSAGSGNEGADLFNKYACNTCHAVDDPTATVGPSLYDVGSRLSSAEIYESIVDPDAIIADGYAPGMMSAMVSTMNFTGSELNKMVKYLASLKG